MAKRLFGFDRLIADLQSDVEAHIRAQEGGMFELFAIESPIEKLFYVAFKSVLDLLDHDFRFNLITKPKVHWVEPNESGELFIFPQCVVFDNWPIDFVIVVKFEDQVFKIAIECDGHDFHERTKEQASRDRSRDRHLQEIGFKVFRFTGSEIFRDPAGCANEVYQSLKKSCLQAWLR